MRLTLVLLVGLAVLAVASGICSGAPPLKPLVYNFPLSYSPGWSMTGDWQFGTPSGAGSPTSGYTGSNVYGTVLSGNITWWQPAQYLTTPAIYCASVSNTTLRFRRWLGIYRYDRVAIEVSNNGSTWTTVWSNPVDADIFDGGWVLAEYDISAVADGQATVFIRWVLGPTEDNSATGWNIDDIEIRGDNYNPPLPVLAWIPYADVSREYPNTLAALSLKMSNYVVTESTTLDPSTLASELADKHVFLVPEPENATHAQLVAAGTAFAPVLQDFAYDGGTVIVCGEQGAGPYGFMTATGLMTADWAASYWLGEPLSVVAPEHALAAWVNPTLTVQNMTSVYTLGPEATSIIEDASGRAALAVRDFGYGAAVMIGYDYWAWDPDAAQVLFNSVVYPRWERRVVVYDHITVNHTANEAARRLWVYVVWANAGSFNAALAANPDAVVVDYTGDPPDGGWVPFVSYLDAGGRAAVSVGKLDPMYVGNLGEIFGVSSAEQLGFVPPITRWDPVDSVFNEPRSVPDLTTWTGHWIYAGNRLNVIADDAEALAGYTATATPGQAALVRANNGRTFYNGFVWDDRDQDSDGDGIQDCVELVMNEITALLRTPEANFSATPVVGVAPLNVSFTDLSTNLPTAWHWDFGDGATSDLQNPTHEYATGGWHTVTLTASNIYGENVETKAGYVHAFTTPAADFSASPIAGPPGVEVQFTDLSANNPTSWAWTFGDTGTSTAQSPKHTYAAAGMYTVSLTATNLAGFDTETKFNYIAVVTPPTINFEATPTGAAAPALVEFTDLSTNAPTSWLWNFGDSGTSTQQNPSREYQEPGFYTVSLTASNVGGANTGTKTRYIAVGFPDAGPSTWAFRPIIACYVAGIVKGYEDGNYKPSIAVSRDQMAVYTSRALLGGDANVPSGPATASFPDVPTDYWAFKYVESAKANNLVTGYPGGLYRPELIVDRGQMAVFIARAIVTPTGDAGLAGYTPPSTPTFQDVPTDFWSFTYIEYCADPARQIVRGYEDGYHPEYQVTRDQMAVYVQRAFKLPID